MNHPAYTALTNTFTRLYHLGHLGAVAGWDQAAMMPPKGNEARGAAMAELHVVLHQTITHPALARQLQAAAQEPLNADQQASLREMQRDWQSSNLLPERLVQAQALAGSRCEHAWRTQRKQNDWQGFLANFREVVSLAREQAQILSQAQGVSPYDALMDLYEPGTRSADIDHIFGHVKTWLPELVQQVLAKQKSEPVLAAKGPFATEQQRALGVEIMGLLGFDFEGGRLDVSMHPFCGGVPEDVRITTRYTEDDFMRSMMGIVHETGHARYEQNLPRDTVNLPVGRARSMGIHESQSLSFEMQLGRSPAFLALIAPLVKKHLGDQPAFTAENLARLYTRVQPGFIRVDADELTYPAHVILRYEIERDLMNGEIEPDDIPVLWDEKMAHYLGVDTRGDYQNGCLQDIHWTGGAFGYFPSYTLGAMYAAQYFAGIRRSHPDLDSRIAAGDLTPVFDWLQHNIWHQASRWSTPELVLKATGEPLNPAHFKAHLQQRYLNQ
ncbi:MAG: carboxypeptidase M32 [Rhodoferax sp.]|uniref:carboxypeptidase M32 n=1 Tax=Rhodoferax sp. TaxID=50421 RepID=UPI001B6E5EE4|nr:carboxypeptidase M32 [Rhodoferax sp.]MBP9149291.1 carboxypeptidase M32 [Rhodoferax sp.]MBP9737071.1 carboxypeptidase M32 [Rhodoferax sp.]